MKNLNLRLFGQDFGGGKPVFENKFEFTAFWAEFRGWKAGF